MLGFVYFLAEQTQIIFSEEDNSKILILYWSDKFFTFVWKDIVCVVI